jgi:hypothetical protein
MKKETYQEIILIGIGMIAGLAITHFIYLLL